MPNFFRNFRKEATEFERHDEAIVSIEVPYPIRRLDFRFPELWNFPPKGWVLSVSDLAGTGSSPVQVNWPYSGLLKGYYQYLIQNEGVDFAGVAHKLELSRPVSEITLKINRWADNSASEFPGTLVWNAETSGSFKALGWCELIWK